MSMMEPWEIVIVHAILFAFLALLYFAIRLYMPSYLRVLAKRTRWYLFGEGPVEPEMANW